MQEAEWECRKDHSVSLDGGESALIKKIFWRDERGENFDQFCLIIAVISMHDDFLKFNRVVYVRIFSGISLKLNKIPQFNGRYVDYISKVLAPKCAKYREKSSIRWILFILNDLCAGQKASEATDVGLEPWYTALSTLCWAQLL